MTQRPLLAVVSVLALGLTACTSSSQAAAPADPATPTTEATTTTVKPSKTTKNGYTREGTELKFGEKALVPHEKSEVIGTLGVVATKIVEGKSSDLDELQNPEKYAGMTPYYVTYTITNESGTDFSFISGSNLTSGVLDDGKPATSLTVFGGGITPCKGAPLNKDFTTVGASFTRCNIELAPAGKKVVGAAFTDVADGVDEVAEGTDYRVNPIFWKQ